MIEIVPFSKEMAQDFYDINAEWISQMFTLEDIDKKVLENPQDLILDPGGYIWFARHSEHGVIGTCALRKMGANEFELTKMGVLAKARGLKAGEALLKFVIDFVRKKKFNCYLLTNKDCQAAIHLYEKNGFVHDKNVMAKFGGDYQRCNVAMRLS